MSTENSKIRYKVIIALILGLMGFFANFYPLNVLIPPNKASFVWGLVFPMLISLSWGWRWGLFSATLGLGAQTMWILWLPKNGWAPFVAIPFYTFWIMWHGWCNEHKKKGFLSTIYSAEIPFRIIYAIVLLTVFSWSFKFNPSPWAPQMTVTTAPPAFVNFLQFKVIFEGYIVLLLADVLMNFKFVRKVLLLTDSSKSKSDYIISGALLFGLIYWILSGIVHYLYSHHKDSLASNLILDLSPEEGIERLIVICMCLVAGLIISNYFSKYRESEEKYRTLFNSNQVGVSIVGADGDILDVNSAFCEMLGYSSDELKLKSFKNISHPDELDENRLNFIEMVDGKRKSYFMDKKYIHKQGHIVWGNLSVFGIFDRGGNFTYGFAIIRDISTKKEYEVTINNSLKEKEVLLKEVHHRVKNNMAVMSSLLSLQSGYVEDKKALSLFKESQSRIRSMALVHEKLYKSKDFAHIDVRDYVQTLAQSIKDTFAGNADVNCNVDVQNIELDIDVLIPCGLVINEILTNSFKHAFDGQDNPEINVSLIKADDDNVVLTISDTGVGFPEGFDISKSKELGLKLVSILVNQITGTLNVESDNGVTYTIAFPKYVEHARHLSDNG